MIVQLNPQLPLLTPKGKAYAHFLIDYSQEHDLQWVCFIRDTGECWMFPNPEVRLESNETLSCSISNKDVLEELKLMNYEKHPKSELIAKEDN
jgi:hypothetical protein